MGVLAVLRLFMLSSPSQASERFLVTSIRQEYLMAAHIQDTGLPHLLGYSNRTPGQTAQSPNNIKVYISIDNPCPKYT